MDRQPRYPLAWPPGWKRTSMQHRQRAAFGTRRAGEWKKELTVYQAIQRLMGELSRLGAANEILSTNMALRLDGLPRGDQREPTDPGAAVYFKLPDHTGRLQDRCLACDRWTRTADNIAAIAAHIECLRGVDRYGVGSLDQAFAGYAALPPSHEDWWLVLVVKADADPGAVKDAYRALLMEHHPDRGGDPELMSKINRAYQLWEATRA